MSAINTLFSNQPDSCDYQRNLLSVKLGATLAKRTAKAFLRRDFAKFDAASKDFGCQFRAYLVVAFADDSALKEEVKLVCETAKRIENTIVGLKNKPKSEDAHFGLLQLAEKYKLDIELSEKLRFLLLSHMLTIVAVPCKGGPRKVDSNNLSVIDKSVFRYASFVEGVVAFAQRDLSKLSMDLLRAEYPSQVELEVSCLFVNVRAIMELALQKNLVIQLKTDHQQLFYRASLDRKRFVQVEVAKGTPQMMIHAEAKGAIDIEDLGRVVELAASLEAQFGHVDDPELIEQMGLTDELAKLRKEAKQLLLLSIKHFSPGVVS